MANLDFEAKYTSGGNNEIGELGDNFNRMSQKLEKAISELKQANNSLQQVLSRKRNDGADAYGVYGKCISRVENSDCS